MTDLDAVRRLVDQDAGLAIVTSLRADGSPMSSLVNAGVLSHPDSAIDVVGFVSRGSSHKLGHLRGDPRVSVAFRAGWEWATVDGAAEIIGPDDAPTDNLASLLRAVFAAAGGTHDDWDTYDRVMREERRAAVLVNVERVYSNPGS